VNAAMQPAPAAAPARPILAFDLETQRSADEVGGWGHAAKMGLAVAVVEDIATGEAHAYRESEAPELLADLQSAALVVGYNVKRFDYAVLGAYAPAGLMPRVPTFDILEEIQRALGFLVKLADVARLTLGSTKSGDGLQSLSWVRDGRLDLVEEYCRQDVRLTANLYEFGRDRGYLLCPDRKKLTRRVRFAFPAPKVA